MWFSRRAGSKHILDDLDRSISKFDLRSSQVKVTWWFRWVMLHINRCALVRQTFWCHSHVCVSIQSKVIDKKAKIRRNVPPRKVIWRHQSCFLGITFWLDRDTDTGFVPVSLFRQGASADMQHDLHEPTQTLTWDDLRSNFEIDLSRSSSICFEPARLAKHIDVKIMVLTLILQDLFTKNYFHIKRYFYLWWPLEYWLKLKTYMETSVASRMSFQMLFAILF